MKRFPALRALEGSSQTLFRATSHFHIMFNSFIWEEFKKGAQFIIVFVL